MKPWRRARLEMLVARWNGCENIVCSLSSNNESNPCSNCCKSVYSRVVKDRAKKSERGECVAL